MHFKENKEEIKKRTVFVLLILFTAILQNTNGFFPKIHNASAMLLIPLTVCIAMFENDMGGMFMGLFAGVVWDFYSIHVDGFYGVILVSVGYACAFLIARYMRNNFVTAIVFTAIASLVCVTLYWLCFILPLGISGAGSLYVKHYLLCAGYTVLLTPLYYYFVRMIALKFRKEEKEAADERLN